jgi:transketolase
LPHPHRFWAAHPAGYFESHGEPPGDEELNGAKRNLGWPEEPRSWFLMTLKTIFEQAGTKGAQAKKSGTQLWQNTLRLSLWKVQNLLVA